MREPPRVRNPARRGTCGRDWRRVGDVLPESARHPPPVAAVQRPRRRDRTPARRGLAAEPRRSELARICHWRAGLRWESRELPRSRDRPYETPVGSGVLGQLPRHYASSSGPAAPSRAARRTRRTHAVGTARSTPSVAALRYRTWNMPTSARRRGDLTGPTSMPVGRRPRRGPATASITLRMRPEVKARFLAEAERLGMEVDDWLIEAGELAIARRSTR